jgi:hypothetical protein
MVHRRTVRLIARIVPCEFRPHFQGGTAQVRSNCRCGPRGSSQKVRRSREGSFQGRTR